MKFAVRGVPIERLQLSKAPVAELAAAAITAQEDAGLEAGQASFLVIAVEPDQLEDVLAEIVDGVGRDARAV